MMTPLPALRIDGTTALIPRNEPTSIDSMIRRYCSSVWSSKLTRKLAPALLQRIETGPSSRSVAATASAHSSGFWTSSRRAIALPPAFSISSTTAWALSGKMSVTQTAAPSAANRRHWAPPIPPPPPVTSATLPSSFIVSCLPSTSTGAAAGASDGRDSHASFAETTYHGSGSPCPAACQALLTPDSGDDIQLFSGRFPVLSPRWEYTGSSGLQL